MHKRIVIGDNSIIASGVNILDSNGHVLKSFNRTFGRDNPKDIIIGKNVWLGVNSIILKGTEIGNNSIVGAGSVVQGIFPKNASCAGRFENSYTIHSSVWISAKNIRK